MANNIVIGELFLEGSIKTVLCVPFWKPSGQVTTQNKLCNSADLVISVFFWCLTSFSFCIKILTHFSLRQLSVWMSVPYTCTLILHVINDITLIACTLILHWLHVHWYYWYYMYIDIRYCTVLLRSPLKCTSHTNTQIHK